MEEQNKSSSQNSQNEKQECPLLTTVSFLHLNLLSTWKRIRFQFMQRILTKINKSYFTWDMQTSWACPSTFHWREVPLLNLMKILLSIINSVRGSLASLRVEFNKQIEMIQFLPDWPLSNLLRRRSLNWFNSSMNWHQI